MKIAYLVNSYPLPSHTFIRREIRALERLGWQIHRFAMRSDRAALVDPADLEEDSRTEHLLARGLPRLLLPACAWLLRHPRRALHGLNLALRLGAAGCGGSPGTGGRLRHLVYLAEAAQITRRCADLNINHIHAHFGTNSTAVAALANALGGPGFSFTVHGPEEFDAPRALGLGLKIARARFVVAISSYGRSQLYRCCPLPDWPKIKVVHCGLEPDKFPAPLPMPTSGLHLIAIGRLSEQKGFPLLIEAMALAAKRLPNLQLTICGDGPLRPQIEAEIARHGLGGKIRLAGWLGEAALHAEIGRAHALILPSLAEGLPMVVMEAMAAARPIIATCINGVPELVTPETGWLVPAGDPAALACAIETLSQTPPAVLAEMGQSARSRALTRHNADTEAAKLAAFITEGLAP